MPVTEVVLRDLAEIVGRFEGITPATAFTKIKINGEDLLLETGTNETMEFLHTLKGVKTGDKIAILRMDDHLFIRGIP